MQYQPNIGYNQIDMLSILARAKINLTLEILEKRNDSYHNIASIMQTIEMGDTLSFQQGGRGIKLICDNPDLNSDDNIVLQAAKLLRGTTHCKKNVSIILNKKIPLSSGLAGGSSDAAVTLMALNNLWELNLPFQQLHHMASALGSDVPFFLYGGTALAEGRGDWITPLPSPPASWIVLLHPPLEIANKTQSLYASIDSSQFTSGILSHRAAERLNQEGALPPSSYYNAFEPTAFSIFPTLKEYYQKFTSAGADKIHLAGSGPTLFTILEDQLTAESIHKQLEQEGLDTYLTQLSHHSSENALS
ncbi:MAG: 4-(cytidine 5'-diphospho)-2-C-methyl-D-erythritol kinase [Dehalococcoidia bacterium]|nr:4-(cytidine 5'-diphospho)-2-C-methyl-D-erythritol kinase [Dehalococcoidia bacterium]